ncbi:MAG: magnesium transporter CorA family protein [Rubrivivax sp.]
MRVFHVSAEQFTELPAPPDALPGSGFLWVGVAREDFRNRFAELQAVLQRWTGGQLVDLHVSDLANAQLPSHFDDTSWYDLLVFRRLAAGAPDADADGAAAAMPGIDTSPVGFAVFDRVLLTVHPSDCTVRDHFAARLADQAHGIDLRGSARLPAGTAELMLRMVNHMVDSYLDLRRQLTRHLGTLQQQLLDRRARFHDWRALLDARDTLHQLEDLAEDQRSAVQEWIDALDEWPAEDDAQRRRERELLRVRSRDVLEHVERVLSHVRRLQQSAESAVQIHFSALANRTNDIMRTLTVLTAVFLPLNLITGFFGMNFDALPLVHSATGIWVAVALMAAVFVALFAFFWRKRYLGSSRR